MSNNKSLGSSPIGLKSENSSMGFIPDLGVADSKKEVNTSESQFKTRLNEELQDESEKEVAEKKEKKKKIVSYNLEVELINKVKTIATKKDMFYSTLVSNALKSWFSRNTES